MTKEQIQKIVVVVLFGIGGLYVYFSLLLGPLSVREEKALKEIKKLEPGVKAAKTKILQTAAIAESDTHSAIANELMETMKVSIPEGAAVAWFPRRITEFFKRHGVERSNPRPVSEEKNAILPDYKNATWEIGLPRVEFASFANAVAGLENENGLMQINSFQINSIASDVQFQGARLNVTTLVKQ